MKTTSQSYYSEVWAPYPKLPNRFLVSSWGRIMSLKSNKIMRTAIDKHGYERMTAMIGSRTNGTRKTLNLKIHRMVAETFLPKPSIENLTVNHKDLDKRNNNLENLEWLSNFDNLRHGFSNGAYKNFTNLGRKHTVETRRKLSSAARINCIDRKRKSNGQFEGKLSI